MKYLYLHMSAPEIESLASTMIYNFIKRKMYLQEMDYMDRQNLAFS